MPGTSPTRLVSPTRINPDTTFGFVPKVGYKIEERNVPETKMVEQITMVEKKTTKMREEVVPIEVEE